MKTTFTLIIGLLLFSNSIQAKVKEVEIFNVTNKSIRVAVHIASSPNELGTAISNATAIEPNKGITIKEKFEEYSFINAVLYRADGTQIVVKSELNKNDSPKNLKFNVSEIKQENIDEAEVDKMQTFLTGQINAFKQENSFVIKVNDDANSSIPEFLGSVIIVDLSDEIEDKDRIRKTITARQLGINQTINFKGDNIEKIFRLSKDFATSVNAKFPGIFETDFNFDNSDLMEMKYSIINMGSVLYQTQEGVSTIDLLNKYELSTTEEVYATIANTLDECSNCKIYQVNRLLSFEGIAINFKRFKSSNYAISGNAASVVTGTGAYKYEEGNEFSRITTPKVIALGLSSEDLSTAIFTSISSVLEKQINAKENERSNAAGVLQKLDSEITDLKETLEKYKVLLGE